MTYRIHWILLLLLNICMPCLHWDRIFSSIECNGREPPNLGRQKDKKILHFKKYIVVFCLRDKKRYRRSFVDLWVHLLFFSAAASPILGLRALFHSIHSSIHSFVKEMKCNIIHRRRVIVGSHQFSKVNEGDGWRRYNTTWRWIVGTFYCLWWQLLVVKGLRCCFWEEMKEIR